MNTHPNSFLSESEIDFLKSKGFVQDDKKNSGYYFYEEGDGSITNCLIPYEDGSYKLEVYEPCYDGDGGYYTDYSKYFSEGKTLVEFINYWFGE
mgnify:FL=1